MDRPRPQPRGGKERHAAARALRPMRLRPESQRSCLVRAAGRRSLILFQPIERAPRRLRALRRSAGRQAYDVVAAHRLLRQALSPVRDGEIFRAAKLLRASPKARAAQKAARTSEGARSLFAIIDVLLCTFILLLPCERSRAPTRSAPASCVPVRPARRSARRRPAPQASCRASSRGTWRSPARDFSHRAFRRDCADGI